jgi:hypothetical protein
MSTPIGKEAPDSQLIVPTPNHDEASKMRWAAEADGFYTLTKKLDNKGAIPPSSRTWDSGALSQ